MLYSSGNPENGELYIGLLCLLGNPEKVSKLSPLSDLEPPKGQQSVSSLFTWEPRKWQQAVSPLLTGTTA